MVASIPEIGFGYDQPLAVSAENMTGDPRKDINRKSNAQLLIN